MARTHYIILLDFNYTVQLLKFSTDYVFQINAFVQKVHVHCATELYKTQKDKLF